LVFSLNHREFCLLSLIFSLEDIIVGSTKIKLNVLDQECFI